MLASLCQALARSFYQVPTKPPSLPQSSLLSWCCAPNALFGWVPLCGCSLLVFELLPYTSSTLVVGVGVGVYV